MITATWTKDGKRCVIRIEGRPDVFSTFNVSENLHGVVVTLESAGVHELVEALQKAKVE